MEIPKRKFALEEKDLAIEADENNKVAEEKENRYINKIQKESTDNIKHLKSSPSNNLLSSKYEQKRTI